MKWKTLAVAVMLAALPFAAGAVEPDEILDDPALEARAREISKDLRCVVCQNQDIDSSNAGVARDLRLLVRERLVAGDTDAEVIEYVRARYGDYVLLKPPFKPETYALWLAPALLVLFGVGTVIVVLRSSRKRQVAERLSEEDERLVAEILAAEKEGRS
ncbi:cytochrome c-type biogenesis protein CcmH [Cribrihabitans marinus]|uniref:Cytochrome c-type biogenesis protein n=1 Tax=Cribrihabitans marinus TaxID=1227549 RepID=A0A1H6QHZ9_9RHOB|nr:cytochrome c-type biogenesis protein [Cribrihabitans marinus]GGH18548.1 cytochrome c-type biogenesis protein CcmH [Cribrihabitans marinus]SEI41526.1 cytochrome c-type biogenesis protein CcmH [Cribrihabitans marinus]